MGAATSIALQLIATLLLAKYGGKIGSSLTKTVTTPGSVTPASVSTILDAAGKNIVKPSVVVPPTTTVVPSTLGKALSAAGKVAGPVAAVTSIAMPFIMNAIGKTAQAGGVAGGAVAQAAGRIPANLFKTPPAKSALYGYSPLDALSGISEDVGNAAGVGVSTIGNAVGSSIGDFGNYLRIMNMQKGLSKNLTDRAAELSKLKDMPPALVHLMEQEARSSGALMRGY